MILRVLFLFIFVSLFVCELKIYSPVVLNSEFKSNSIKYSLANFGHIPYGRTLIGPLKLSNPLDACSPISLEASKEENESPFLLIKRGNCTFVAKVKYAQLLGAKIAIIMDDKDQASEEITMMDDGYSYSLRIPSIFIEKRDGQKLIEYLTSSDPSKNNIILTITFDVPKSNNFEYSFWLSTSNRNSFRLVREYEPFYRKISDISKFVPHYNIWTCEICARNNFTLNTPDNCISGGRYCCLDPDGRGPATGAQVVLEDLRQICIYRTNADLWWNYMMKFDSECIEIQVVADCSNKIMKELNINVEKINECYQSSFLKQDKNNSTIDEFIDDNLILMNETRAIRQMGIQFWPTVTINNASYKGNLEGRPVFEAVCSSFPADNLPENCYEVLGIQRNEKNEGINVGLILVMVISCLILFFLFLVFVYRKWVRSQITNEMSSQVDQMVTQYIAFYENRDKKIKGSGSERL